MALYRVKCYHLHYNVQFQKYTPQKRCEFPGGGGAVRPTILKKCMKTNQNFQWGGLGDVLSCFVMQMK